MNGLISSDHGRLAPIASAIGSLGSVLELDSVLRSIVDAAAALVPLALGATAQLVGPDGRSVTRASTAALDASASYRSRLAVPLEHASRPLGVLAVVAAEAGAFDEHDEELLRVFAASAAIAIAHAVEHEARVQAEKEIERCAARLAFAEQCTVDLAAAQVKLLEQERLEHDMQLAAQVQASLRPHAIPDLPGFELTGVAEAARYVSGDLYGWIGSGPEHVYLAVADVSGKGVPAALMASAARALLSDAASRKITPGEALTSVNRSLYDDLTRVGGFFTVVAAYLDRRTAAVDYANAGHTEVLWYRATSGACERLPATAPPVGVLPDLAVPQRRIGLCPGDVLLFYSDGVTEAERERDELFGVDRLEALVRRDAALPAAALARSVVDAVDLFSGGIRNDDLTLIVVKALPRTVAFRCASELGPMEGALELVRALGKPYGDSFAYELELAVSEILTNIIQHAYQGKASGGEIRGEFRLEADRIQIDVYDRGLPFELASVPACEPDRPRERGYGVHIVRQLMDEVDYWPATEAGNHWRLVKRRDGGARP